MRGKNVISKKKKNGLNYKTANKERREESA